MRDRAIPRRRYRWPGAWLLCLIAAPAVATELQDHASIRAAAQSFLEANARSQADSGNIEVRVGQLDSRLRLRRCSEPLTAFLPDGARLQGNTTVGVRCPAQPGWTLYVPGKVAVFAKALVTRRALARGTPLGPDDVQLVERDVARLHQGYLDDPADIEGMQLKRPVGAGTVLTRSLVQAPRLVKRGQRVTLEARTGAIAVRMAGEAVSDGSRGQRIRVRALDSRRIVEGVVVSSGVVKVTL